MSIDNFSKMFPESNKKRLHVLVSILVLVIVIGSVVVYQISREEIIENIVTPPKANDLTPQQRNEAISELKKVVASSTPLTDTQRAKAIEELRKAMVK